jgi:hypothetical protein
LNANVFFFSGFFWISPCVWPNSGFWCCVFLTLRITLLYHTHTHIYTFTGGSIYVLFLKLNYGQGPLSLAQGSRPT